MKATLCGRLTSFRGLTLILLVLLGAMTVATVASLLREPSTRSTMSITTDVPRNNLADQRTPVPCPHQDSTVGVILVLGQSNAANYAEKKFGTKFPSVVVNYLAGRCYTAMSPLLGASGGEGEFITPLADKLIENDTYKSVVIIAAAVGGSQISDWSAGGMINRSLIKTIGQIDEYQVTDVIWHQGEADFIARTTTADYETSFNSLKQSLNDAGVVAPIFISIATKCGYDILWVRDNQIAIAQRRLVDNTEIFLAADTDDLLEVGDRRPDECHLAYSGQLKVADAYAHAIRSYHQPSQP